LLLYKICRRRRQILIFEVVVHCPRPTTTNPFGMVGARRRRSGKGVG
jgi:hypothetical protein